MANSIFGESADKLAELFDKATRQVKEDSTSGAVAGFSAPSGGKIQGTSKCGKKKPMNESDGEVDREFEGEHIKITRAYRGPHKGVTIMISQNTDNGDFFGDDSKVQAVLDYIESIFE